MNSTIIDESKGFRTMFAYIPARGGSKRIPGKNIRSLAGKPAIGHVLENLASVKGLKGIAVSSDDAAILKTVSTYAGVVTLDARAKELSDDHATFMDLVRKDLPRFCEHFKDSDVLIVLATAVLVKGPMFAEAVERFQKQKTGCVLGVTKYEVSAHLALVDSPSGSVKPLFPEAYLKPTAQLSETFYDAGCFYVLNVKEFNDSKTAKNFLDLSPVGRVVLPHGIGMDIDTMEDWERLERSFNNQ